MGNYDVTDKQSEDAVFTALVRSGQVKRTVGGFNRHTGHFFLLATDTQGNDFRMPTARLASRTGEFREPTD